MVSGGVQYWMGPINIYSLFAHSFMSLYMITRGGNMYLIYAPVMALDGSCKWIYVCNTAICTWCICTHMYVYIQNHKPPCSIQVSSVVVKPFSLFFDQLNPGLLVDL